MQFALFLCSSFFVCLFQRLGTKGNKGKLQLRAFGQKQFEPARYEDSRGGVRKAPAPGTRPADVRVVVPPGEGAAVLRLLRLL